MFGSTIKKYRAEIAQSVQRLGYGLEGRGVRV
jgi:hypothetical protein